MVIRALSAAVLAATIAAAPASAQQQPPPQPPAPQQPTTDPKPAPNKNVVVVSGCLSGSLLTHTHPKEYIVEIPESLRLTGSRAMRSRLKEANGHTVELVGVLKGFTDISAGALVKDTGKTKVYVGGTQRHSSEESMYDQQRIEPPSLDVSSIKDLSSQCMETKSE